MEVEKMRQIARIACAGLWNGGAQHPAFAQEAAGLEPHRHRPEHGSGIAMAVAVVLFIMSFWSVGVAIERIYTYNQARKQSKLYAPQVAKHLKDGRLKEADRALGVEGTIATATSPKVVLAGLQEYQFQQETGGANLEP